ncbi:MAG: hypothetical protein WCI95_08010 [bacterium]
MSYFKINTNCFESPEAEAAVSIVNELIDTIAAESKAIEADGAALLNEAATCEPGDAAKLFKSVDALRVRRLKNLLQELRVPALKEAAFPLLIAALDAEIVRAEAAFNEQEAVLNKHAAELGYDPAGREYLSFVRTNPLRRDLMLKAQDTRRLKSTGTYALTVEDTAATEGIKKAIAGMLR